MPKPLGSALCPPTDSDQVVGGIRLSKCNITLKVGKIPAAVSLAVSTGRFEEMQLNAYFVARFLPRSFCPFVWGEIEPLEAASLAAIAAIAAIYNPFMLCGPLSLPFLVDWMILSESFQIDTIQF